MNLPQDAAANLPSQSPVVTSPPRVKQRVSDICCFISGPQDAADSAVDVDVVFTFLAQLSCFVQTSLLVPEVPDGFVEISRASDSRGGFFFCLSCCLKSLFCLALQFVLLTFSLR